MRTEGRIEIDERYIVTRRTWQIEKVKVFLLYYNNKVSIIVVLSIHISLKKTMTFIDVSIKTYKEPL